MWVQALCIIMLIGTSSTLGGTVSGRPPDIIAFEGVNLLIKAPRSFSGNVTSVTWDLDNSSSPTQIAEWNPGSEPEVHAPLNKEQDKLVLPSGDLSIGQASKTHGGVYTCHVNSTDAKHEEWNSRYNVEIYDKGQRTIQVKGQNTQVFAAFRQQLEINLAEFSQGRLMNKDVTQIMLTLEKDNVSEDLLNCSSFLSSEEIPTCDTEKVDMQSTGTMINLEQPGLTTLAPKHQDVIGSTLMDQAVTTHATPSVGTNLIASIITIFVLYGIALIGILYLASN